MPALRLSVSGAALRAFPADWPVLHGLRHPEKNIEAIS
jgi:hypothetical protein